MPVRITRFVAAPAGPVTPGTEVKLEYATEFVTNVQIDQGIGAVAPSGSVTVRPNRTSIYTLSAWGLAAQTKALTITVIPP
jgi:hypothetical protein